MAESDFPHPYVIGYGSSPSRCRPDRFPATGRTWDLPVPVQRASTHARFFDHAGSSRRSRLRARLYSLPPSQRRQHPGYESLRGSMAGLCAPLPTLRRRPRRRQRTARGRCGSLLLHRIGLAPTTHCRSPGALRKSLDTAGAIKWTRLSCRTFAANAVRLQLHALAYNLGNFLRTLATPEPIKDWSLASLKEKLIKIGAKVVSHGRYVIFQMAEVAMHGKCSKRFCGSSRSYGPSVRRSMSCISRATDRRSTSKCQGKWPDQTL